METLPYESIVAIFAFWMTIVIAFVREVQFLLEYNIIVLIPIL